MNVKINLQDLYVDINDNNKEENKEIEEIKNDNDKILSEFVS